MISLLYLGIGMCAGIYLKDTLMDIWKVHNVFCEQHRVNTVVSKKIERYLPLSIIHLLETGKFLATIAWVRIEQVLTQTCVKQDRHYRVQFVIDHKLYRLIIKPERGPGNGLCFQDSTGKICSKDIHSYLRGNQSVVQKITPKLLGYDRLDLSLDGQRLYSIEQSEYITR